MRMTPLRVRIENRQGVVLVNATLTLAGIGRLLAFMRELRAERVLHGDIPMSTFKASA